MTIIPRIRLLFVLAVSFSLASLPSSVSSHFQLPTVPYARAQPQPCPTHGASGACSEKWIPAGPAMDTLQFAIFTNATTEYQNINTIDFTDWPANSSEINTYCPTTNTAYNCTAPISEHGYFEIQFMMDSNFWGVDFQFGNNPNGVLIRQGIAHLIDRSLFVADPASSLKGASAIDNPLPTSNGGLPSPNPCGWDIAGNNTSTGCAVGAVGGTAYNLGGVRGGNGLSWLAAIGSADFCSAAKHFILAGLATGMNSNCTLTGHLAAQVTANPVNFFVRVDNRPLLVLGDSIVQGICAVFTGQYTTGCGVSPSTTNILAVTHGPITAFVGFQTKEGSVNISWNMYTAGYGSVYPFDSSLYFGYNSIDVSGFPGIQAPPAGTGTCSDASGPSFGPQNYEYICVPQYDNLSSQMEFAPCKTATGDPVPGATSNLPTSPGNGICYNTNKLSAVSAGIQAEDYYGSHVLTLPIFEQSDQFPYVSSWQRVINNEGNGLPNFFTWLNAYNPNPALSDTIRQGFSQTTTSVNPYVAKTPWDQYVTGNIYDSLYRSNPLQNSQTLDWMDSRSAIFSNATLVGQGYNPPQGTLLSYEFTLRGDLYFQNGRQVTAWDIAYSYLSARAAGAYESSGADVMSGFIVKNQYTFDISVSNQGPFTQTFVGGLYVMPGEYWSNAGSSSYLGNISACSAAGGDYCNGIYTLGATITTGPLTGERLISCTSKTGGTCGFSTAEMQPDPTKIVPSYDPIAGHILIGSGPWQCGTGAGLGQQCVPVNGSGQYVQNPGAGSSYTLTRFGAGVTPGNGLSNVYFRSAGTFALYQWTEYNTDLIHDFLVFTSFSGGNCYERVSGAAPLTSAPPPLIGQGGDLCAHYEQGIGNPPIVNNGPVNSDGTCANGAPRDDGTHVPCTYTYPHVIEISQVSVMEGRFGGVNWVSPYNWATSPPTGVDGPTGLVLHEGGATLTPATTAGGGNCGTFHPTDDINKLLAEDGYDC